MNEQEIVKQSILEVFKSCGYIDHKKMTQRDFEHISDAIEKKSGIVISGTTIKRLSIGEFSRLPQVATLNAIAAYFDFKNWQEYKSSLEPKNKEVDEKIEVKAPGRRLKLRVQLRWALLVFPVAILSYYLYPNKIPARNFNKATFSAHKNTTNDLPNTVVFNYNVDDVIADSFFIQQSWDKNRRVRVYKNSYTATDIYYEPGYHIAKLIANDSVISTIDVSIPTDKWFFLANENKVKYSTEYIKTDNYIKNGSLAITAEEIRGNRIETDQEKMYIYSYFPTTLTVSSDDYILKTRVRMKEIRNNFCPFITLEVYCQRNFMLIKSTSKGCASEASILFGEKEISGKENDLASIAYDVTQWTDVEVTVRNKHVVIKINGKDCFSTYYTNSARLITGLGFISNGLCEVDKVEFAGMDGKIFYRDDFNGK